MTTELLNLVAVMLSSFFAIYGLLHNYKENNKVTKHGKIAIIGIILTFTLTGVAKVIQIKSSEIKIEKEKERIEINEEKRDSTLNSVIRIVKDIQRISFPLEKANIAIELKIPEKSKSISYINSVVQKKILNNQFKNLKDYTLINSPSKFLLKDYYSLENGDSILYYEVNLKEMFKGPFDLPFYFPECELSFNKQEKKISLLSKTSSDDFCTSFGYEIIDEIEYYPLRKVYVITLDKTLTASSSNGKIISIVDLFNSYVNLTINSKDIEFSQLIITTSLGFGFEIIDSSLNVKKTNSSIIYFGQISNSFE